jgi:hypothetical protein
MTCGVPGPVDLPYEVRQDRVGATGVDEKEVSEIGGTDSPLNGLQKPGWLPSLDEEARPKRLDDDVPEATG